MAEASLAFPAICLALSFLFVVAVYNASIMQHLRAVHRRAILPAYQQIAHKFFNCNPGRQSPPNHMSRAGYEPVNLDTKDEEEQHPPPPTTSSMSSPDYHRYADNPALDTVNVFRESGNETQVDGHGLTTSYAGGPYRPRHRPTFAELGESPTNSPSPSPPGSSVSSDEYGSDWSNSAVDEAVFEPRNPVEHIPVWEFEVQRPIYTIDHEEQSGPVAWLDDVVEWTSQGVFAFDTPDILERRG
ncbi:hypothetical protein N7519_006993 [Penicillium mononematosum]|uniref:uncharacterized protein n=1 Tax=Penicillium mononematosum TaxID=268346 RepID=UPI0025479FB9|nr:uncharacterized protein N7519_006993 [Penicillium mononematosum]KAJ6185692.1 hypothetical protein N7519_006993 [Penicillium mononematosum]